MRLLIVCTSLCVVAFSTVTNFEDPARASQPFSVSAADDSGQPRLPLAEMRTKDAARFSPVDDESSSSEDVFELAFAAFPMHNLSAVGRGPLPELRLVPANAPAAVFEDGDTKTEDDLSRNANVPLPAPRPQAQLCQLLASAAEENELPVGFLIRLIWQESRFNPNAVSHVGAQGVAQFMPRVAAEVGLEDPFDPEQALPASARLLRTLYHQFGNLGLAAAAYNAGAHRIHEWLTRRGKLPNETRHYVMNITGSAPERWKTASLHSPDLRVPSEAPCKEFAVAYVPLPPPAPQSREDHVDVADRAMSMHRPVVAATIQPAGHHAGKIKFAARVAAKKIARPIALAVKAPAKLASAKAKSNARVKLVQLAMAGHGRR